VLGQGQCERARSLQVLAGTVPEAERAGRPGGVPAEAPVQRVRKPHQVVEARRGERGSRHDFRSTGRRFLSRPRRAAAPAATAAAATGTGKTAQPQPDQTVQPEGQTADQGHDYRWRRRWG